MTEMQQKQSKNKRTPLGNLKEPAKLCKFTFFKYTFQPFITIKEHKGVSILIIQTTHLH